MSEPKLIKDIILDISIDKNEPIGKTFIQCPFIQAELLRQDKSSLDDLTDEQIHNLVEHIALEDWLDNQDVSNMLHVSPRTLQTLRSNGTLPFSRIGGKIYYLRRDIQKILADNYTMYKIRNEYEKSDK